VRREQAAGVVWSIPEPPEEDEKYKAEGVSIADYGEFSGKYVDITKSSYLGRSKKSYL
jgi:hypothetical protein